jgi:hypothetical protein
MSSQLSYQKLNTKEDATQGKDPGNDQGINCDSLDSTRLYKRKTPDQTLNAMNIDR